MKAVFAPGEAKKIGVSSALFQKLLANPLLMIMRLSFQRALKILEISLRNTINLLEINGKRQL
jgi:hypothetical protein